MAFPKIYLVLSLVLSTVIVVLCSFCGTPLLYKKFEKQSPNKRNLITPMEHVKIYPADGGEPHIKWGNIRIKTYFRYNYNGLFSTMTTRTHWKWVERYINRSVKILQSGFSVRQLNKPILFERYCKVISLSTGTKRDTNKTICDRKLNEFCPKRINCYGFDLPDYFAQACYYRREHPKPAFPFGPGISNADLALFVYIVSCQRMGFATDLLAAGVHCSVDDVFHIPTSGIVMFCIENLASEYDFNTGVGIALHEITHVLFAGEMINEFHTDYYGNAINADEMWKIATHNWLNKNDAYEKKSFMEWRHRSLVQFGKNLWGCSSFSGIELFNQSGKYSHFSERLYWDALMGPRMKKFVFFTELDTLALEATGWYRIDKCALGASKIMNRADKGCDFLCKSCFEIFKETKDKPGFDTFPYCRYPNDSLICTRNGEQIVQCKMQTKINELYYE